MNKYYPHLFSPIRIKNRVYKNRIEASPMGVVPTHHFISSLPDYGGVSFFDKSLGGVGAMHIVSHGATHSHSYVSNGSDPFQKYQLDITQEQMSVGKQHGAVTSICLGVETMRNGQLLGPSELQIDGKNLIETTIEMINEIIDHVVDKAITAKKFGFDAITLDIAHDSPVALFMAPRYNKRLDQYGGVVENRFRFARELVKKVRSAVGLDFIIELRLSAVLHLEASYEFEEMLEFIKEIENDIDIVNVCSGMDEVIEGNVHAVTMLFQPHLKNVQFAQKIKEKCAVYVSVGGAIMTPQEAEEIIATQKADFVMLGRSLLADPFWPKKAEEGRSEDIVPCLRCNYCYHIATKHFQTMCSVNPRLYREKRVPLTLTKTKNIKKVAIIGGGPAGCKAALIASQKGHIVDLYEKDARLGGQLNVAQWGGNHKVDLKRYRDYLETQILKSDIHLILNTEVSKEFLQSKNYDTIIVAVGAVPIIPQIEGVTNKNVFNCIEVFEKIDCLDQNIVIIGGGSIGVELGIHLAEMNKNVTILEKNAELASQSHLLYKAGLKEALKKQHNLNVFINTNVEKIMDDKVIFEVNHQKHCLEYNQVILACGMKSRESAFDYYGIVDETYIVGDCKKVGKVLEATNEAYFIAAHL